MHALFLILAQMAVLLLTASFALGMVIAWRCNVPRMTSATISLVSGGFAGLGVYLLNTMPNP